MRDVLLARIRPVVERLAEQLVEMLLARVDQHINQLELAFECATSAYAHDLEDYRAGATDQHETEKATHRPIPDADTGRRARAARADHRAPAPAQEERRVEADEGSERGEDRPRRAAPATRLADDRAARGADRDDRPVARKRKPNTCSKCHAVGFTAQSCGKTHNLSTSTANAVETPVSSTSKTSPASRDSASRAVATTPATSPIHTPPPTRSERLAQIDAARARREAAQREAERQRDERARSFVRRGRGPTRGAPGPFDSDGSSEVNALPEPIATFDL